MKKVVIYTSQTGFTKRYAEWIGEAAEAEAVDLAQAKKLNLRDCDTIILGSHVCADNIVKAKKFAKILRKYPGKKCALFVTGASPAAPLEGILRQSLFTISRFALLLLPRRL